MLFGTGGYYHAHTFLISIAAIGCSSQMPEEVVQKPSKMHFLQKIRPAESAGSWLVKGNGLMANHLAKAA